MVGNFVGYNPRLGEAPLPWGLSPIIYPRNKPIWFVFVIPQIDAEIPSVLELTSLHAIQGDISFRYNGKPSTTGDERNHSLMTLGVENGDLQVLGTGMSNNLSLENILYPFIPGFYAVKEAAIAAGAFGCCISGAGPTVVALTHDQAKAKRIGDQMIEAFRVSGGVSAMCMVRTLNRSGAKIISRVSK